MELKSTKSKLEGGQSEKTCIKKKKSQKILTFFSKACLESIEGLPTAFTLREKMHSSISFQASLENFMGCLSKQNRMEQAT